MLLLSYLYYSLLSLYTIKRYYILLMATLLLPHGLRPRPPPLFPLLPSQKTVIWGGVMLIITRRDADTGIYHRLQQVHTIPTHLVRMI